MNLARYTQKLATAVVSKNGVAMERLCRDLEYEQLGEEQWPQDVFEFFLGALRDHHACSIHGSMSFIASLYDDFDKLSPEQRTTLLQVLDCNADNFGDEMLRHSTGDLIARRYAAPVAMAKFKKWVRDGSPRRLHMAQVGFEVLVMAKRLDPSEESGVREILRGLRRSNGS